MASQFTGQQILSFAPAPAGWVNVFEEDGREELYIACPGWLTIGHQTYERSVITGVTPAMLKNGALVPADDDPRYTHTLYWLEKM